MCDNLITNKIVTLLFTTFVCKCWILNYKLVWYLFTVFFTNFLNEQIHTVKMSQSIVLLVLVYLSTVLLSTLWGCWPLWHGCFSVCSSGFASVFFGPDAEGPPGLFPPSSSLGVCTSCCTLLSNTTWPSTSVFISCPELCLFGCVSSAVSFSCRPLSPASFWTFSSRSSRTPTRINKSNILYDVASFDITAALRRR